MAKEGKHGSNSNYNAGKMGHKGERQGDMSTTVDDMQRPMDSFSQAGLGKTLEYVSRHNAQDKHDEHQISKQSYKGRYS